MKNKGLKIGLISGAGVLVCALIFVTVIYILPVLQLGKGISRIKENSDGSAQTQELSGAGHGAPVTDTYDPEKPVSDKAEPTGTTAVSPENRTEKTSGGSTTVPGTSGKQNASTTGGTGTSASGNAGTSGSATQPTSSRTTTTGRTAEPVTNPPVTQPPTTAAPQKNEYDIYMSGHFYIKGTSTDETGETVPMELAITENTIYMMAQIDSVDVGILADGKNTYMVYPAAKKYCELNALFMKAVDMDTDSLISSAKENYSKLKPLSSANEVRDVVYDGQNCRQYRFNGADGGYSLVHMSGTKLLNITSYESNGSPGMVMNFSFVTDNVPADRIAPGADYTKLGMLSFVSELMSVMEE